MTNKIQPLKGMKDIVPSENRVHTEIVNVSRKISNIYGYEEFSTPLLEMVSVFDRTLGETSDIVSKEMYDFKDKGDRHICLRPEFTASVLRGFISSNMANNLPQKLFSHGPLFRYDRPQAGRYRQFHQINFECLGISAPEIDAEIIEMATKILDELKVLQEVRLEINSLGCSETRAKYSSALTEYFSKYKSDLSADSRARLEKNPLRILDSKDEKDKIVSATAPTIDAFYSDYSLAHFTSVLEFLDMLGIEYNINKKLARGLDYYCHTTFEFITDKLGSQGTLLAGGRYDNLCKMLGGPDVPGIGFAGGIERIALLDKIAVDQPRSVYIIPISSSEIPDALRLTSLLRASGISTILSSEGKLQKRIQKATANRAKYAIFIGEEEKQNDMYKVRNLDISTEKSLGLVGIMKLFREELLGSKNSKQLNHITT